MNKKMCPGERSVQPTGEIELAENHNQMTG